MVGLMKFKVSALELCKALEAHLDSALRDECLRP